MPGRTPLAATAPVLFRVAQPMPDEPPSKKRPDCVAVTIVDPKANVSGSTAVLCWLVVFVNGPVNTRVRGPPPSAPAAPTSRPPAAVAIAHALLSLPRIRPLPGFSPTV